MMKIFSIQLISTEKCFKKISARAQQTNISVIYVLPQATTLNATLSPKAPNKFIEFVHYPSGS